MNRLPLILTAVLSLAITATGRASAEQYHRTLNLVQPAAGVHSLTIRGGNGDLHLSGDDGTIVRIEARLSANSSQALQASSVHVSRSGGTITIEDACSGKTQIFVWSFANCGVDYVVHYPKRLALDLRNENGDINVSNAGGDVRVADNHGDTQVALATDWRGSTIAMSTSAGDLILDVPPSFKATLDAHTHFGDVSNRANLHGGPVTVTASTTFGDIEIRRE